MDPYNPGKLVTHGGRILTVVGKNKTMDAARNLAYQSIKCIDCDSTYYRNDIAASINI
jgi:phosphoribosylamine--glycine ligase